MLCASQYTSEQGCPLTRLLRWTSVQKASLSTKRVHFSVSMKISIR